jgi:hypothetical protein
MSQTADILKHLKKHGEIDAMTALNKYDCFRLASRINDLRNDGVNIETTPFKTISGKTVALYKLKR